MPRILLSLLLLGAALCPLWAAAQTLPSAGPTMTIVAADGSETEETAFDGSAPMTARFAANVADEGQYTPYYEWQFRRDGQAEPFIVRYDAETEYTFVESGAFTVTLLVSFVLGTDTLEYEMDQPFTINISESRLEVPNAFTPNGDGVNDVFKVKDGYESIVSFRAQVFNRWGRKLYEWNDPAEGWDGKSGGSDVPDGAYYLVLKARGADGRDYNIKKVINILRGYSESSGVAE